MTKYKENRFQHIYPVVHKNGRLKKAPLTLEHLLNDGWQEESGYITIDCVTDHFDYEVPFSDYRDFDMQSRIPVGEIHGLPMAAVSGVDSADLIDDLGIFSLKQPKLPLREVVKAESFPESRSGRLTIKPASNRKEAPRLFVSRIAQASGGENGKEPVADPQILPVDERPARRITSGLWIKALLAATVGYGTYKLFDFGN